MKTIFELMLIIFDFVSDLLVGIGLYQACHKVFAGLSLTFLALPSILILLFLIISCNYPFKTEDRMTKYIKEKSGLYPVGLMGLIFIRPLSACIIRIWKCCNEEQFGKQTTMGLKLLEIIFQSMPQLIFTCYVRAQLGPGNLKWISEYIHFDLDEWFLQHLGFEFDERLFSIAISYFRICADRSAIHSTNMGEVKRTTWTKLLGYLYMSCLDTCLVLSIIVVFNIIFGIGWTFLITAIFVLLQVLIQKSCFGRQGLRCFELAVLATFGPLVGMVHEIKREKKIIWIILNRLFLYLFMVIILFLSTIMLCHDKDIAFFSLNHLHGIRNSNCDNICQGSENCDVMKIAPNELFYWTILNWLIFAYSTVNAIAIFVFRKNCCLWMDLESRPS